MTLSLRKTFNRYSVQYSLSRGTQAEYRSTLKKWENWNSNVPINQLGRMEIAKFLDYVFTDTTPIGHLWHLGLL